MSQMGQQADAPQHAAVGGRAAPASPGVLTNQHGNVTAATTAVISKLFLMAELKRGLLVL
jgi:hypothetical protein